MSSIESCNENETWTGCYGGMGKEVMCLAPVFTVHVVYFVMVVQYTLTCINV